MRGTNYTPEGKACRGDPLKPQDEPRGEQKKERHKENLKSNGVCDKQERIQKEG